uniref:PPUP7933 n=1 Tax=Poeciliopsis prolifica TaxID=188132 RepID=A0A0S7ESC4_9TELE
MCLCCLLLAQISACFIYALLFRLAISGPLTLSAASSLFISSCVGVQEHVCVCLPQTFTPAFQQVYYEFIKLLCVPPRLHMASATLPLHQPTASLHQHYF